METGAPGTLIDGPDGKLSEPPRSLQSLALERPMGDEMPELVDAGSNPIATLTQVRTQVPPAAVPTSYDYGFLYGWQQEALKAWHSNARRGVVEAVTGSGITRVGIAAAFEAVRQGIKVLILVPTAELQRQWLVALQRDLSRARRGALGDGRADSLDDVDILVAIAIRRPTEKRYVRTRPD